MAKLELTFEHDEELLAKIYQLRKAKTQDEKLQRQALVRQRRHLWRNAMIDDLVRYAMARSKAKRGSYCQYLKFALETQKRIQEDTSKMRRPRKTRPSVT
jgi:hypothetical protein